jgi:hypothetical protein
MKLKYKGIFRSESQLPQGILPNNAVQFKEPDSMEELAKKLNKPAFCILVCIVAFFIAVSVLRHGKSAADFTGLFLSLSSWIGILFVVLSLFLHEFLHAICFGKGKEVELFISWKFWLVVCVQPITKRRFIFMSLFPNVLLGWLPLLLWVLLPYSVVYSNGLFIYGAIMSLSGAGDYLNAYNAIRQMPKGSMQQLSGMNSYWFMP